MAVRAEEWDEVKIEFSWKRAAIRRVLEPESRGIAIVKRRYQAMTCEDVAGWKRLSMCSSDL
jgi:hypothetical protein